jgi:predicted DCC family thiol-disulfide oxidoreductase YuxK
MGQPLGVLVSDISPAPAQPADDTATGPHIVYYNSACPVCDAGVCAMRARISEHEVEWVDVHRTPERLAPLGLDLEDVRERLHVLDPSGRLQVGAPALLTTWSLQSRWGWLLKPLNLPGLRTLTTWAYIAFARQLYRWNRRQGHW